MCAQDLSVNVSTFVIRKVWETNHSMVWETWLRHRQGALELVASVHKSYLFCFTILTFGEARLAGESLLFPELPASYG
jgi:hypothetical protein